MGSGECIISRDVYRLAHGFDFFRQFSFYFSSVGSFFSQFVLVLTVWALMYAKLILAFTGLEDIILKHEYQGDDRLHSLYSSLTTVYIVQLYFLQWFAMLVVISVEHGFGAALTGVVEMLMRGSFAFYGFQVGLKGYFVSKVLTYGDAAYVGTGRGFVIDHKSFSSMHMMYYFSHYVMAMELLILLVLFKGFGSFEDHTAYWLQTLPFWILVCTWLYTPFLYNPSGLDWMSLKQDYLEWTQWMFSRDTGKTGALHHSWEAWFSEEMKCTRHASFETRVFIFIFKCRSLIPIWGLIHWGASTEEDESGYINMPSIFVAACLMIVIWGVIAHASHNPRHLSKDPAASSFRRLRLVVWGLVLVSTVTALCLLLTGVISVWLMVSTASAAILLVYWLSNAVALSVNNTKLLCMFKANRDVHTVFLVRAANQMFHFIVGHVIMLPVLLVAFIPFMSSMQGRILFNDEFNDRLKVAQDDTKRQQRQKQHLE